MQSSAAVLDDSLLLRSYADRGDAAAFAELVRRYADMVYATARRVTGSAAEAEDVAQDCFLRLAQGSAAISGSLAAWLHRTSLNRALEVARSEQARKRREATVAATTVATAGITAEDSRELIARVDEALAALADELRIPLTEHFLCGRSQSDIALGAGVNQSTISRRIETGLSELRQRLRAQGVAPAAVAALPLLFGEGASAAALAPPGLRAALTKIGMSGVGPATTPAATAAGISATSGTIALIAGAALIVLAGGWWLAGLRSSPAPRRVTLPAAAAATQASATQPSVVVDDDDDDDNDIADGLDDLMDRDDDDDDDDDNDDDLIPTSAPARRQP